MRMSLGVVCLVLAVLVTAAGCSLMDYVSTDQDGSGGSGASSAPPTSQGSIEPEPVTPSSQPAPTAPPQPGPADEEVARSFAGCWESDQWGWMRLESSGTHVTGIYEHDEGRIDAVVSGAVLVGTWSEAPSYAPPKDAGLCEFTLSADGRSFTGHWRYGSDGGWDGTWTATRVDCAPANPTGSPGMWAGIWDTSFGEMRLQFSGDQVTGSYAHDSGLIEGTVSERIITGIWSEAPSYAPPNDAGQFEFTLSEDGQSFTGRWRFGSEGAWSSWSGTRRD